VLFGREVGRLIDIHGLADILLFLGKHEMALTLQKDSPLILVVDDDKFTRMLLRQLLEQEGYTVAEVEDGEQCLSHYTKLKPDMVLLDALMPEMDGFTCCTKLQQLQQGSRIPVLMITGLNDQASVDRAFAAGATDYITKPIHPPVLRQRLRRLLEASWAEQGLRASEQKYRSVVENLKEIIFHSDSARQLQFLNPAWTGVTGFSVGESLGRCFSDFLHPNDIQHHREQIQSLLESQTRDCCYQIRVVKKNGGIAYMEIKARLLSAEDGTTIGISGTLNDITERKRREQHQSVEHATTRVLANSANLKEAMPQILQAICKSLGWDLGEFWSVHPHSQVLHCVETWHLPALEISEFQAATERMRLAPEEGLPGRVWASGLPIWIDNVAEDTHFLRGSVAKSAGLHAAFAFPLLSGEETLGVMTFFSRDIQLSDPDLLRMMVAIGCQIGQFIKRKQAESELQRQHLILQSELKQAADYVRSLLPLALSKGVTARAQFVPSLQLGGDAFDYYWLDEEHLAIYLLDVAGHGVKSALLSVSVLNILRSQSLSNTNFYQPSAVLAALNRVFQMGESGDDYFTIWYGIYNRTDRQISYACAGHPPAILLSDTSTSAQRLGMSSLPIGMISEVEYAQASCEIKPDSTLYVFSDGVYEIHQANGDIWGLNAFIAFLNEGHKNQSLNPEYQKC
jgi:sigma-B regulation protein RsbU (phosphoserine phosphatase)